MMAGKGFMSVTALVGGGVMLAMSGVASAAILLNDGTTTAGLSLVSNIPLLVPVQTYPSTSAMSVDSGTLLLQNGNHFSPYATYAVRAAWVSDVAPASATAGTLTVSADIRGIDAGGNANLLDGDRYGLIMLNSLTNKGVILYTKNSGVRRIATLDFNTMTAADSVIAPNDFTLDSGFTYTATSMAQFSLSMTPNGANTDLTAVITQNGLSATRTGTFANLTGNGFLPTDMKDLRLGYFGYISVTWEDGFNIGNFDNLTLTPVPEPTSLGLVALAAGGLLRRRRHCQ